MSDSAIKVHQLNKRYRIGLEDEHHDTLAQALFSWVKTPMRNYQRLKKLSSFEDGESDDIFWALRDVDFEVHTGEVVGLIGRNGAGKSTLLKILSRITEPTSGYADIRGRVSSLLEVGTGFHPELTGRENVYLNGTILGMSKAEVDSKFDEIVDFAEIERFIDTPVKRYSSGMSVRLAFAVAAHLEPEILLVDEVLAVGDLGFQRKSLGKMDDVARSGRTVLFVSHNMAMIQSLCTRGIVLENGAVVCDASIEDAINEYVTKSEQNMAMYSLGEREDRVGGQNFRFIGADFLHPETGAALKTLLSGQPVLIRLRYTCERDADFHNTRIIIPFFTSERAYLFACSNHLVGTEIAISKGEGEMYCYLPKWPLSPGRYLFDLYAGDGNNIRHDYIKEAGKIDVELGNFYGGGMRQVMRTPGVYVDFEWQVDNDVHTDALQPENQTVIG